MISSRKILLKFSGGSGLDFIKSVSIKAFSAIALLVSSSLLARSLAPAGFGAYTYIFSTTTIFLAPVSVALGNVILRDLGRIQSTALGMHEMNRHISTALVVMCVLLVLPMTWIVWSVRDIGVDFRGWYGTSIIALCGVLVVSMALNGVVASIFQVHNEIALSNAINALVRPMLFLLIVGVAVIGSFISLRVAVASLAASSTLALLVGRHIAHKRYPHVYLSFRHGAGYLAFIAAAIPFILLGLVQSAYGQMAIIALRKLGTVEQVGILGVAILIASPPSVITGLAATYVTTAFARSPNVEARQLAAKAAPVSFALALGTLVYLCGFAVVGRWLISKVYGDAYANSYEVVLIVLGGQLLSSLLGFAGQLLNMRNLEKYTLACSATAVGLLAVSCALLIPTWGVVGAALSTAIAIVFGKFAYVVVARIKLGAWVLASPKIIDGRRAW